MASREAMYRVINNADGVCNIDSDPGFLAEGTFDDYNKVLQGCRALLDRYNLNGKQAKSHQLDALGLGTPSRRSSLKG